NPEKNYACSKFHHAFRPGGGGHDFADWRSLRFSRAAAVSDRAGESRRARRGGERRLPLYRRRWSLDQREARGRLPRRDGGEPGLCALLLSRLCVWRAPGLLRAAAVRWSRGRVRAAAARGGSLLPRSLSVCTRAALLRPLARLSLLEHDAEKWVPAK